MTPATRRKIVPLILTAAVILADQASKLIVIRALAADASIDLFGDFMRITLRRSPAVILSPGVGPPPLFQTLAFLVLPLAAAVLLAFLYFSTKKMPSVCRLPFAAVLGGGAGNLLDRFFRPGGEVTFIDVRCFGIFGLERWPAFNISHTAIVSGVIAIMIIGAAYALGKIKARPAAPAG